VPGEDNRGTGDWFWSGPEAEDVAFSHSLKLVIPKNTMEKNDLKEVGKGVEKREQKKQRGEVYKHFPKPYFNSKQFQSLQPL
jgi:hypothetical protein